MRKERILFVALLCGLFLFGASIAFAQQQPGGTGNLPTTGVPGGTGNLSSGNCGSGLFNPLGCRCTDLSCPIKAVTDFLFTISIPIVGIIILVGGFQMMTSAGNPEKFSQGKKTILYAVIGFVVILLAGSVAALIQSILGTS